MKEISFEEFKSAVYKSYKRSMSMHDPKKVDEYFNGEEAETTMRNEYEGLMEKYRNGIINENVVLGSGAGGCAYCLVMMF